MLKNLKFGLKYYLAFFVIIIFVLYCSYYIETHQTNCITIYETKCIDNVEYIKYKETLIPHFKLDGTLYKCDCNGK